MTETPKIENDDSVFKGLDEEVASARHGDLPSALDGLDEEVQKARADEQVPSDSVLSGLDDEIEASRKG